MSDESNCNSFIEYKIPDVFQNNNILEPLISIDTFNYEIEESTLEFSQKYVEILSDLMSAFPVQVPDITIPFKEIDELEVKIRKVRLRLKQVLLLKNRKQILVMFFLLGQLIFNNNVTVKDCGISKYQRRVAFKVYHLYEYVGVKQIL